MPDVHALTGAYAVDALDDVERARFERHLAECPDCAAEVASLREAAARLALTAEPVHIPAMREEVLRRIRTVRPLPPVSPLTSARHRVRRLPGLLVAAVAAFAVVAGGVGVAALHPFRPQQAPVAASVAQQVIQAADARNQSVTLPGGGRATVYHSRSVDRAVLVTRDMPAAPSGKDYELWFESPDGTFVPAGLMDAGGSQTFVLHGKLGSAAGVGVTVEPAGGSKAPTSAPVALFDLAKSV